MRIGKLEFNEEEFAIRKCKGTKDNEWYYKIGNISFTKAEVMKMKVDENKTLDLNCRHFRMVREWIKILRSIGVQCGSIDLLEREMNLYKLPHESYVYVICGSDDIPKYVGISHDKDSKQTYWGSSETFRAQAGDRKYIVADKLNHTEVSQIEEHLMWMLKRQYPIANNTPGSGEGLSDKLRKELKSSPPYEIYIK